jgi:cytoskeleton protein RodZ
MPVEPKPKPKPAAPARAETAPAAAPTQTASAPPAPPAAPAAPAAIQAGEIVIRAQVDSWVEVRDADNAPLVSRLLRAGDEYEIPAGQGLKLVTGNAGALSVFVDGNEVPPLAPPGAVRRYIALDAERLRQGTALIE